MTALLLALVLTPALAADSPHGASGDCAACHVSVAEGTAPAAIEFAHGGPDRACKMCHEDDPHQVGMVPQRAEVPESMLLHEGKLACFSCHDEPACDGKPVDEADRYFFRGGPYRKVGELCAQCHQVTGLDRFNPHAAMEQAASSDEACEHCHLERPQPGGESALKVSGPNTCLGCHTSTEHAGSEAHMVEAPKWAAQGAAKNGLPLDGDGAIVCITCHDPHPPAALGRKPDPRLGGALFPSRWVAEVLAPELAGRGEAIRADAAPILEEPGYLRMSLGDGALCTACHTGSWGGRATKEAK